ncbi:DNA adenine methylase [Afifella aestuarii]|uniref:DNA adenine methylase n=1 Tax=Afifella aestuarii TaxID=1909496 RepID=UPI001FECD114|nr:DNA adenine methylase [Afifella aestuarii]
MLRWHGGKWRLAPWIISHFPAHRVYVEPFGGAGSVLLRKPRVYAEIYNDLDDEVVTLFRVLRNPDLAERLIDLLQLTPFARTEFRAAYEPSDDPVEQSRRLIIRSFMGFGSNAHASWERGAGSTGFRADSRRDGTTPAKDWSNYVGMPSGGWFNSSSARARGSHPQKAHSADWEQFPGALPAFIDRLRCVVIENRPASEVMAQHDAPTTLHYIDPPYLPEVRGISRGGGGMRALYRHEMTRDDHAALLEALRGLAGMVVLSGYPSPLYDDLLPGWLRVERKAYADGARERTECLWLNPACQDALGHGPLFAGGEA